VTKGELMSDVVRKLYEKHHIEIKKLLTAYEYRYYRYRLEYSLVFFYLPKEDDISEYAKLIRLTDTLVIAEKYFCYIVYEGAKSEQAVKAANNLLNRYKKEYPEGIVYINVLSPGKKKICSEDIVTRLFESLEATISEEKQNTVISIDD
jgi:hypothetical protein